MTLRQLKWIAILGSVLGLVILEIARNILYPVLLSWPARLLVDSVLVGVALVFYSAVFNVIGRMQDELAHRNRELQGLYEASVDIPAALSIEQVLQKVVDLATDLLDARYGALALYDEDHRVAAFLTSGISPAARDRMGPPPNGRGLLGVVLDVGERLRLDDLTNHPDFGGFPPGHPQMRSLLAVPVCCGTPLRGNLYVAEQRGGSFSAADERTLARFAAQAANAIDNAYLRRRVRDLAAAEERARIAREMHDGLAQVLAYVNTKAQAVREHLVRGRARRAEAQLDQLAKAARDAYGDVREAILGLRTSSRPGVPITESLEAFIKHLSDEADVTTTLEIEDIVELPAEIELQLLRITQEALANVRKHSAAESAVVRLCRSNGQVLLTVEDDGVGFDPERPPPSEFPRFGIPTMRERADVIGAEFDLQSRPGEGTRIDVTIPIRSGEVRA